MGVEQNLVSMKRQVFEAREWEWDATEMDEDEEYEVKAILGVSLENGFRSYRVQWSDLTEGWEPEDSLTNVAEMLLEFHAEEDRKAAAACRKGSGRKAKARKKKQVVVEESVSDSDEEEQPSSKRAKAEDEDMRNAMMLMANSVATMANMSATKADAAASKDGTDGKLPGMRDLMGGFKRLKQVGQEHFMLERTMRRQRKSVMMADHLPFAKKYNKRMDSLLIVETRKMECEFQLRELREMVETAELREKITEKEVRLKMITEEWLVIDDTLDLLQGCSDKAMTGKEAQAWQMWDDAQEEQRGCSKTAELKKRETAAEANLKLKAQTDQALYLAMQLGQQSAMYGGKTGNSFQQQQQGQGKGHGQQQQAWQGQAWQQQQQQGWQPQQQGWPAQGGPIPRPIPPGPPPNNPFQALGGGKGGKGKGKMAGTYGTPTRFNFGKAEDVLGTKCPGHLRGVLIPLQGQMRFGRPGKSLRDPPKPPNPSFAPAPCKQCWRMPPQCATSHEAFSCEEVFDINGVPAKGFRQLFQMGLLDDKGDII